MRLQALRSRAPERRRDLDPLTPRRAALALLADKIAAGKAGLDPYDPTRFIVELAANEIKWGTIAVCYAGWPVDRVERPDGTVRLYAVFEADARRELRLDAPNPPLMEDEPLASRGVAAAGLPVDAILAVLPGGKPGLHALSEESEGMLALRRARQAYDDNRIAEKGQVH